ncbi:MAG: DUF308 domain-containing protein [Lachnospiraceae bacterium]|nr:DUF308 domain-containing protein [Lachnospiraceae bacterium]
MEEKRVNRNYAAMMAVVVLSVLCIIAGAILAIDAAFPVAGFIYVTSGFAIVGGCWLVLRFFMKAEYMSVSNYDFSTGILLIVAGILLIIQAKAIVPYFIYVLGILLIVLGVCVLQFFLQCAFMRGPFSAFLNFVFAAAIIALGSAFFLADGKTLLANLTYFYLGVMLAGILGILSLLMTFIRSVKYERWLSLSTKRNVEDEPYTETYLDVKRSRDRNLEDQPFTVKELPPEPNPGRLWNEPVDEGTSDESDETEDKKTEE